MNEKLSPCPQRQCDLSCTYQHLTPAGSHRAEDISKTRRTGPCPWCVYPSISVTISTRHQEGGLSTGYCFINTLQVQTPAAFPLGSQCWAWLSQGWFLSFPATCAGAAHFVTEPVGAAWVISLNCFFFKWFLLPALPPTLIPPVEPHWQLLGMLHTLTANIPAEGRKSQLCKEGLAGWAVSCTFCEQTPHWTAQAVLKHGDVSRHLKGR